MKWYNGKKILSYNKPFNFIIGGRGIGKSFYWLSKVAKNYLNKGEKFIYVRRYADDVKIVSPDIFKTVNNVLKTNIIYKTVDKKGCFFLETGTGEYDKKGKEIMQHDLCGYAIGVTQFQKMKSTDLSDVTTILYDEFLSDTGTYLKNELDMCLGFYMTVARGFNTPIRENCKFIFISNNDNFINPFFTGLKVDYLKLMDSETYTDNGFCIQFCTETIKNTVKPTEFQKMLAKTEYGEYALENKAIHIDFSNNNVIPMKMCDIRECEYAFNLHVERNVFSVHTFNKGLLISDKNGDIHYCDTINYKEGCLPLEKSLRDTILKQFLLGNIWYENKIIAWEFKKKFLKL